MNNQVAIILCAGKGTRMNDESTNKVCFEVAGVPVIRRVLSAFRKAGVNSFVVVVGYRAEKVMECLADEDGVAYAFQSKQQGTGSAALCGLSALRSLGYTSDVIISAGDMRTSSLKSSENTSPLINRFAKNSPVVISAHAIDAEFPSDS